MSGINIVGQFHIYDVNRLVKGELDIEQYPIAQRIDAIQNSYEYKRVAAAKVFAESKDYDPLDRIKNHIVLYSKAGIFLPIARKLKLLPSLGASQGFTVFPTAVAYGRLGDVDAHVLEELQLSNLENLVRMSYDDVTPEGWCTIFRGNDVVEIR